MRWPLLRTFIVATRGSLLLSILSLISALPLLPHLNVMIRSLQKIPAASLYLSRPDPRMFGNGANENSNPKWTDRNWLASRFHFNFAEFHGGRSSFGVLRVLNDDLVQPKRGFGTHGHRDFEIITLVVHGKLTHQDSISHRPESLGRASVQFMSAGSGVQHSEQNLGGEPTRFIQSWVVPRSRGGQPVYGGLADSKERQAKRTNAFEHLVGDSKATDHNAPVRINQDCNYFLAEVDPNASASLEIGPKRQAYILQIEGSSMVSSDVSLDEGDAATVSGAVELKFQASAKSLILVIEMAAE